MAAHETSDVPILILAAGASTRMQGRDKLSEKIAGSPLLRHQVEKALAVSNQVVVTVPPAPHSRYDIIAGLGIETVSVKDATSGISASLRAGINALPEQSQAAMVLLADLPDLTADDLRVLLSARHKHPASTLWRGTTQSGKPGHPILFDAVHFPKLKSLTGDQGASRLVTAHAAETTLVKLPGEHALRDLDTPEDWAAWRAENGIPH